MARGAILPRLRLNVRLQAYALDHLRTLIASLGRLHRAPLSSIMTTAVIGIALALPSGLYVLLANVQSIAGGWDIAAKMSLFLKLDTPAQSVEALAARLRQRDDVADVELITAEQAMREFRSSSGLGEALAALEENPLPPVLVVTPTQDIVWPEEASRLMAELGTLPTVELVQLDTQWLQRLRAIMDITWRGITAIATILGLGVLLIVGNTIRLDIQNRREEIEVIKLVGATDAFIRRPFLYSGIWYGLFGGLLAWLLIFLAMLLIQGPAEQLALLYESERRFSGPGIKGTLLLLSLGAGLGLLGSWLAVGQHLHAIEPR